MRIPERNKQLLNMSEPSRISSLFNAHAQIFKYRCLLGEIRSSEIPDAQGSRNSFTSSLTRLVRSRTTFSSSASFLPQINAKLCSVLLRPSRRIVCSPKPNQVKNFFIFEAKQFTAAILLRPL